MTSGWVGREVTAIQQNNDITRREASPLISERSRNIHHASPRKDQEVRAAPHRRLALYRIGKGREIFMVYQGDYGGEYALDGHPTLARMRR